MAFLTDRARSLADIVHQAGEIAKNARLNLKPELKGDGSIVTNADREVELWLRSELAAFAPGTTVWGEEFGFEEPGPEGIWLVDPVDGTSNFTFGSPLWGVSVGLVKGSEVTLGSVSLPDLNELYIAEAGFGAYRNNERIPPIPPGPVRDEQLVSYGDWLLRTHPNMRPPGKMRLSGAFVIDGTFTAMQRYRGLLAQRERLYDAAACIVIASECSADIRYTNGEPLDIAALARPVPIERPWMIFPKESGFSY
jgi:myo-inositol-1(or 4)-monophosphatase